MKQLTLTLGIICLLISTLFGQSFWQKMPAPHGMRAQRLYSDDAPRLYTIDLEKRIFRSEDSGLNWIEVVNAPQSTASGLWEYNFKVGSKGTLFARLSFTKVMISSDKGETWAELNHNLGTIYDYDEDNEGNLYLLTQESLFRSSDNGISWQVVFGVQFETFQAMRCDQNGIMMVSVNTDTGIAVNVSYDKGLTWRLFHMGQSLNLANVRVVDLDHLVYGDTNTPLSLYAVNSGGDVLISIDPINSYFVYTDDGKLIFSNYEKSYISVDMGSSWQLYSGSVYRAMLSEPVNGNIFKGTAYSGDFRRSSDLGQSWHFSGYGPSYAWVNNWIFKGPQKVYGLSSAGLWYSPDAGTNWSLIPMDSLDPKPVFYSQALALDGSLLCIYGKKLLRFSEDLQTFTNITPPDSLGAFARIMVDTSNGAIYLTSTDKGLVRSLDNAQTWVRINSDIDFDNEEQPIVFHSSGRMFAVVDTKLLSSGDEGMTWTEVKHNPPYNFCEIVKIAPNNTIFAMYSSEVTYSSDNGVSWTNKPSPVIGADEMVIDQAGNVFVASNSQKNIARLNQGASNWTLLTNIPSVHHYGIMSMAIDASDRLWVCLEGAGIYRTTQPVSPVRDITADALEPLRIYPNPSNQYIQIQIPAAFLNDGWVEVYDLYGKTCMRIPATQQPLDISGLSAGMYWVRISQGNIVTGNSRFVKMD